MSTKTFGQVAYENWAPAHCKIYGFRAWQELMPFSEPRGTREDWEKVAIAVLDHAIFQVKASEGGKFVCEAVSN